jgi:hypothetical protein
LAKKFALALTSDLFNVLLLLLCGTKSDFLDFLGEATPTLRDRTTKLAKSSETIIQRNSLRGRDLRAVSVPQLLRGAVVFGHPWQFKRTAQMRGHLQMQMESIMPDL